MRFFTSCVVVSCLLFSGCSQEKPILNLTEKYGVNGKKATMVLYKKGGHLVVPESPGRRSVDHQVFDVIENIGPAGDKLITFRLGKPDAAPLTIIGAFGIYACAACELYGLSPEWVAIKLPNEK